MFFTGTGEMGGHARIYTHTHTHTHTQTYTSHSSISSLPKLALKQKLTCIYCSEKAPRPGEAGELETVTSGSGFWMLGGQSFIFGTGRVEGGQERSNYGKVLSNSQLVCTFQSSVGLNSELLLPMTARATVLCCTTPGAAVHTELYGNHAARETVL